MCTVVSLSYSVNVAIATLLRVVCLHVVLSWWHEPLSYFLMLNVDRYVGCKLTAGSVWESNRTRALQCHQRWFQWTKQKEIQAMQWWQILLWDICWRLVQLTHICLHLCNISSLLGSLCLPELVARAVLVDMEPKVISQAIAKASKSGRWRYGDKAHFSQKQGSGNNWANG